MLIICSPFRLPWMKSIGVVSAKPSPCLTLAAVFPLSKVNFFFPALFFLFLSGNRAPHCCKKKQNCDCIDITPHQLEQCFLLLFFGGFRALSGPTCLPAWLVGWLVGGRQDWLRPGEFLLLLTTGKSERYDDVQGRYAENLTVKQLWSTFNILYQTVRSDWFLSARFTSSWPVGKAHRHWNP